MARSAINIGMIEIARPYGDGAVGFDVADPGGTFLEDSDHGQEEEEEIDDRDYDHEHDPGLWEGVWGDYDDDHEA